MDKFKQNVPVRVPASVYLAVLAVCVLVVGLASIFLLSRGSGSESPAGGQAAQVAASSSSDSMFPDYVMAGSERVQMAYQFAVDRPDVIMWMPCYCGCGGHSGHKSARNCFVKEGSTRANLQFDQHGSNCDMCVSIALDTKSMLEQGKSLKEIRAYIDGKFSSVGPGTNTPLPPG